MLKEGFILGLLAPMFFRARSMTPSNDASGAPLPAAPPQFPPMPELPGLPPLSVATVGEADGTDQIPWPELPRMLSAEEAAAEFFAEMQDAMGGDPDGIRFCRLAWSYEAMRRGRERLFDETGGNDGYAPRPWPPIKDKTLSQLLCALGCVREQRDMRSQGEGRPTFLLIPAAADAVDDGEVEADADMTIVEPYGLLAAA